MQLTSNTSAFIFISYNSQRVFLIKKQFSAISCIAKVSTANVLLTILLSFLEHQLIGANLLLPAKKILYPSCEPPSFKFENDASL